MSTENLTELELLAIDQDLNLADGHPRQSLSRSQREVIERLPELYDLAGRAVFAELERSAHVRYLEAVGQGSAVNSTRRILSAYSSSVVMGVVARCLADSVDRVGLVHPTFDNIPDILRSWNLPLVPLEEEALLAGVARAADGVEPECVFITTPNNPTGTVLGTEQLEAIARRCRERGGLLILDTSFRGFDKRAQYDTYEVLESTEVEYVVIEDTGKLWPTSELKLGILVASENCRLAVEKGMSDVLLSVSPLILMLVSLLSEDAANGGLAALRELIATNRKALRGAFADPGMVEVDADSRVSVARVRVPRSRSADKIWRELAERGLHLLPCGPFHWARRDEGDRYLRVALARDTALIEKAAPIVARALTGCAVPA
jgi:enduracididine biosynthesis enzyme MppP